MLQIKLTVILKTTNLLYIYMKGCVQVAVMFVFRGDI